MGDFPNNDDEFDLSDLDSTFSSSSGPIVSERRRRGMGRGMSLRLSMLQDQSSERAGAIAPNSGSTSAVLHGPRAARPRTPPDLIPAIQQSRTRWGSTSAANDNVPIPAHLYARFHEGPPHARHHCCALMEETVSWLKQIEEDGKDFGYTFKVHLPPDHFPGETIFHLEDEKLVLKFEVCNLNPFSFPF
jgi:hypothetical protein